MFERIFETDTIHTQGAYEIDRQVRARARQMELSSETSAAEETLEIGSIDTPHRGLLVGLFSSMGLFLGH